MCVTLPSRVGRRGAVARPNGQTQAPKLRSLLRPRRGADARMPRRPRRVRQCTSRPRRLPTARRARLVRDTAARAQARVPHATAPLRGPRTPCRAVADSTTARSHHGGGVTNQVIAEAALLLRRDNGATRASAPSLLHAFGPAAHNGVLTRHWPFKSLAPQLVRLAQRAWPAQLACLQRVLRSE